MLHRAIVLLLLGSCACAVFAAAATSSGPGLLSPFLPLPALAWWLARGRMPAPAALTIAALAVVAAVGSAAGPFSTDAFANRLVHGNAAALVALAAAVELADGQIPSRRLAAVMGVCVAVTFGAGLEVFEGVAGWQTTDPFGRLHDTILDLGTDVVGAAVGAAGWWVRARQRAR